jgi:hypothetical protein
MKGMLTRREYRRLLGERRASRKSALLGLFAHSEQMVAEKAAADLRATVVDFLDEHGELQDGYSDAVISKQHLRKVLCETGLEPVSATFFDDCLRKLSHNRSAPLIESDVCRLFTIMSQTKL